MPPRFAESPEFARLVRGETAVSLELLAFELARDAYPGFDSKAYVEWLDQLAERVGQRRSSRTDSEGILGQLRWALHVEEGFRGDRDTYQDARNSYLNDVIDRRIGIPITLSLLYLLLAERLKLPLVGVGLPAHFMLRRLDAAVPTFVDPFHEGDILDLAACESRISRVLGRPIRLSAEQIAPCGPVAFITRMLQNLRAAHLSHGDYPSALPVLRRLAALHPSDFDILVEWGTTALRVEHPGEAIGPLRTCVDALKDGPARLQLTALLKRAERKQAELN